MPDATREPLVVKPMGVSMAPKQDGTEAKTLGLKLLQRIEEQAPANRLSWLGGPRGVFRCAKALDDEGILVLHGGLGDARLPYGRDIRADTRIRDLDRDLADAASARAGLAVAPEQGLSGYAFWAVVGYGYALILCI